MCIDSNIKVENRILPNRIVVQPMEGCDCLENGSPSEVTAAKYMRFASIGAAVIWFEACAVCSEGRANPHQMQITEDNLEVFRSLLHDMRETSLQKFGYAPLMLLQLTHSGRQSIHPIIAYNNALYEKTRPVPRDSIVSDEYLDNLPEAFVSAAQRAFRAGFDGVDVKCCHGYLFQELLSAYTREGRYGGSFENRIRAFVNCYRAVRRAFPANFIVASRIGFSDVIPKPYGFGTTEEGIIDLTEAKLLLKILHESGLNFVNVTIGNPYYNPHVNRPFRVGMYRASENPAVSLQRFVDVERELKKSFPDICFVGSGMSYYRENLMEKAEELIAEGVCDLVGFGRECIAYPQFYEDYLSGKYDSSKSCVACSKCTILMRNNRVSGCATFNEYYKNIYREALACKK